MNVPAEGAKRRLIFALLLLVWFLKFIFGFIDASGRRAPSYPDAVRSLPYIGDTWLYVVMPAIFVALNLFMFVFVSKIPKLAAVVFSLLQFLFLLMLLFYGTGGI
ncbi:hypothetical protein [Frateuria sp. Soil773]|uniref:hypothetical protein n=1 Tax=Frateuria sp. Soil773 TaxID=1736407 RepID=UPI0012F87291|nr:hypothetical protein [Frateuria sp. Soil773]